MLTSVFSEQYSADTSDFGTSETPTLRVPDVLTSRLAHALQEIEERDHHIRMLEQQIEVLSSRLQGAVPFRSQFEAREQLVPTLRVLPATSPSPPITALPEAGTIPQPPTNVVQWHSITIGDSPSGEVDSIPLSQRKDIRCAVELKVEFDADTQFYAGLTQDISGGGVFIATYSSQPVGTSLTLLFELPCGTKVVARGEVRWIRDIQNGCRPGMGVAFAEISDASLAAIARFCRQSAPLYVEF